MRVELRVVGRIAFSAAVSLAIFFVMTELLLQVYTRRTIVYDVEMSRYANEVKVRSDNPRIGHVHRPNVKRRLMGVNVEINSDGLRDREYDPDAKHGHRIVMLGDSITFGWGVEKPETFEERLEAELNAVRPTEVINLAAGNYNTEQQVHLFLEKGIKYEPDEIVLFYFINDAEPTPERSSWAYVSRARSITFFWSRARALLTRLDASSSYEQYYKDLYREDQPGWIRARQALRELKAYADANSIELRVFLLPELHELERYPFAEQHEQVRTFLEQNGIECVDLVPFFEGEQHPRRLWVAADDAHPNAEAHGRIARHVLPFLTNGR